jgi:hypothetical protein
MGSYEIEKVESSRRAERCDNCPKDKVEGRKCHSEFGSITKCPNCG